MNVVVACEYSGKVRDAFIARGHKATSVDLLPTDAPGPHYQGDIFDYLRGCGHVDLLVGFPPCTYLSNSGVRWLYSDPTRWQRLIEGATFFRDLLNADAPRVAIENPIQHKWARQIIGSRQTQVIQPWQFGHPEQKATGLWLKGLSPLVPTDDVRALMATLPIQEQQRIHYASPGVDRWKLRSTTYAGIADAMADQWSTPDLLTAVA